MVSAEAHREQGGVATFARLAVLFATAAIVVLVVGTLSAAAQIDRMARRNQEQLIANGVGLKDKALRDCLSPIALWDQGVVHLDHRYDPSWADTNIGQYYATSCGVRDIYMVMADGALRGNWRGGVADRASLSPPEKEAVAGMIAQVRRLEAARGPFRHQGVQTRMVARPIDATALVMSDGRIELLGASLIQPDFGLAVPSPVAPVVVTVQALDAGYLGWLQDHYLIEGLKILSPTEAVRRDQASTPLTNGQGVVLGKLVWTFHTPASALARVVAPTTIGLLLVLLAAPAILVWRERGQMRRLEAANRAAEEALETKRQFVANLSHEIRTPMNGVLGVLHILKTKRLDADSRMLVSEAISSGRLLQGLLTDLLDLAKISEGRLELALQPMRPDQALTEVFGLFEAQARQKGVAFNVAFDGGERAVLADGLRLRQIMFNLVGNAVKFTDQGAVEVRMRLDEAGPDRLRLQFAVADTGPGIPHEDQALLFERFYQGREPGRLRHGGSGLGLAICRALAEIMGGRIDVESRPGEGSTFRFEALFDRVEGQAAEPEVDDRAAVAPLSPARVLIVEDNPTNRLIATRILSAAGFAVEAVEDGAAGVAAVAASIFDLVLMDIQMPQMDGMQATRAIRGSAGAGADVPVIGLTANVLPEQLAAYVAAGMDEVVAKPLEPRALFAAIDRVMQHKAA